MAKGDYIARCDHRAESNPLSWDFRLEDWVRALNGS